jgi:hypothetical protein
MSWRQEHQIDVMAFENLVITEVLRRPGLVLAAP